MSDINISVSSHEIVGLFGVEGSGVREGYLRMGNIHDVAEEVSDIYNLPFRLANSMCWQVAHDHIDTFKPYP